MLRSGFIVLFVLLTFFISGFISHAQDRFVGAWRTHVDFQCGELFETRAPNIFTHYDFESCIPSLVLTDNPEGGTLFGIYNMAPYLNTAPPDLPSQSQVDAAFTPLNIGTNQIFSIDGPFMNENGQNVSVACTGGFPGNPDAIITEGCTNFEERIAIEDISCFEIDSAYAQGIHYASVYDGSNIQVFQSDDGGFNWENYQTIPGACGVVDDCAKHTTAAWWATPAPSSGICVFYNTRNGNNLNYHVNCTQRLPDGSDQELIDEETEVVLALLNRPVSEQIATTSLDGSTIVNVYPRNDGDGTEYNAVSAFFGGQATITNPIYLADAADKEVTTGAVAQVPDEDNGIGAATAFLFGQNTPNRPASGERNQAVFNNLLESVNTGIDINVLELNLGVPANTPFTSREDIAPLSYGGITDPGGFHRFPAIGGGSCIVSELLVSDTLMVPTLNEWGLIALSALIFIVGMIAIRRRKQVA